MGWNTIQDYINDPAGFESHHRQWKAIAPKGLADDDRVSKLEAVANAARTVRHEAEAREIIRYGVEDDHSDWVVEMDMKELTWQALVDVLDVLDRRDKR